MKAGGTPRGTFGWWGNWFSKERDVKVAPTQTAGAAGSHTIGGVIATQEKNWNLVGVERYRTYGEFLRNVWVVAIGVRYFGDLISKPDWTVEPADKSRAAQDAAEFVQSCLDQLATPLQRIIRKASMSRFFGYSLFEWTATKRDDGMLGMLDLESRPQVTIEGWDLDRFGVVHGVSQRIQGQGELQYIPRGKLLHFVDDAFTDSPEGFGLLRSAVYDIDVLQEYMLLEGQGFETDLRGIPIAKLPLAELKARIGQDGFTQDDYDRAIEPFITFIQNRVRTKATGLYHDSSTYVSKDAASSPSSVARYALDLITGGTTSNDSIGKAIERQIHYLACLFQVEHLLIGGSNRGSQALSKDKSDNYGMTGDSALAEMKHTLQIDFVRPLCTMNGIDKKIEPKLKVGKVQWRDIEQVTGALQSISVANLDPRDPAVNEIRDLLGISRIPEKLLNEMVVAMEQDAKLKRSAAAAGGGGFGGGGGKPGAKNGKVPEPKNQRAPGEKEEELKNGKSRVAKYSDDQPRDDDGKWASDAAADDGEQNAEQIRESVASTIESSPEYKEAQATSNAAIAKYDAAVKQYRAGKIDDKTFGKAQAELKESNREFDRAYNAEQRRMEREIDRKIEERRKPKDDQNQGRLFKAFDPDQPRDADGKWGGGGSGSSNGQHPMTAAYDKAVDVAAATEVEHEKVVAAHRAGKATDEELAESTEKNQQAQWAMNNAYHDDQARIRREERDDAARSSGSSGKARTAKAFDPDQPRDSDGKWASGGGGDSQESVGDVIFRADPAAVSAEWKASLSATSRTRADFDNVSRAVKAGKATQADLDAATSAYEAAQRTHDTLSAKEASRLRGMRGVQKAFDPDQDRDADGKWTSGGGASSEGPTKFFTQMNRDEQMAFLVKDMNRWRVTRGKSLPALERFNRRVAILAKAMGISRTELTKRIEDASTEPPRGLRDR